MEIRERFIKKRRTKLIKISFALRERFKSKKRRKKLKKFSFALRLATYGGKKRKIFSFYWT